MRASDRTTILVIDDDVELTEMLEELLEPEGFTIETCADGDSGFKRALQGNYVLVIL
jgi:DNA-binding response OmpR family regulator